MVNLSVDTYLKEEVERYLNFDLFGEGSEGLESADASLVGPLSFY